MDIRATLCWVIVTAAATSDASDMSTWTECPDGDYLVPFQSDDLTVLNLKNCNITSLGSSSFRKVPNIQVIHLVNSTIKTFDINFKSSLKLEELYFTNNALHERAVERMKLPRLKKIVITDTNMSKIGSLPGDILTALELRRCSLTKIPTFLTLGSFHKLLKLILPHNNIQKLGRGDDFPMAENLQELDLSHNSIETINNDFFNGCKRIETVDISNNKLRHIPEALFQNTPSLISINLRHNLIDHVPPNLFVNTSPVTVDLSHNMLTYLPDAFLAAYFASVDGKFVDFYLDHNPWQCGCLNEILVKLKSKYATYSPGDVMEFAGKEPACVMTSFQCFKPESHMRLYKKMKEGG